MKKGLKIFLRIMPIVLVAVIMVGSAYGISATEPTGGTASVKISGLANNIWATVVAIVQILAIAAIIIAGVRYMFASANDKADIKKQTIVLVVGAVLVFAAGPIATFIQDTATQLIK